jgi:hypothetical protein
MSSPFLKAILLIAWLISSCGGVFAPVLAVEIAHEKPVALSAAFGLAGQWKLGHVCPVRVEIANLEVPPETLTLELTTLDGDGVEVSYRKTVRSDQLLLANDQRFVIWLSVRQGRQNVTITMKLLDESQLLAELRLNPEEIPPPLPSTQPLIVALGDSLGIESAAASLITGSSKFTTAVITDQNELPDDWQHYTACDLLLLPTSRGDMLESLSPAQWDAMDVWIRDGGVCLSSLGPAARELQQTPGFQRLLPGKIIDVSQVRNPGPLESYVVTDDPVREFEVVVFDAVRGTVDVTLTDELSRRVPLLSRSAYGMGIVYTVSADLAQPAFANWRDRSKLWKSLLSRFIDQNVAERASEATQVGTASYLGYDDLIGQLRATLDVFPSVVTVSFGQVAVILVIILILVGPIDYYISVKWLKRPDFSWYFAGGVLAATSLGLALLRAHLRPEEVRVNSVQVVDIDVTAERATGRLWSHVYSSSARLLDIDVRLDSGRGSSVVDWQGLPGRGLGGLMSQLNTDRGMPGYAVVHLPDGTAHLDQVGIPAAGTKCITAAWHQAIDLHGQSSLKEIGGIDQLQGTVVNPLSVDLKDGMLMYHNWYYSLPSRIMPGQSIPISFETVPKDLPRRLNGRRIVGGSELTTPWDPADRNSLGRLMEVMMFYKAASGPSYTTLLHRFQPQLDFSNLVALDRAIVVGRIDVPLASVNVSGEDNLPVTQDVNQVWCRLVYPVEQNKNK